MLQQIFTSEKNFQRQIVKRFKNENNDVKNSF